MVLGDIRVILHMYIATVVQCHVNPFTFPELLWSCKGHFL